MSQGVEVQATAPSRRGALWSYVRTLLFILGLALVAFLVKAAGPRHVADVMISASPWLPPIVALEMAFLVSDSFAVRSLLGERARNVPRIAWLRSAALAYALMILLPAGRAAGEMARAASLAPFVEKGRAAFAVARLNAAYMFANAATSSVAALLAVHYGGIRTPLAMLVALNALATGGFGAVLVALSRSKRLKSRVRARFPAFAGDPDSESIADERPGVLVGATLICFSARCAQALQYGLVLAAVGAVVTGPRAILTLGLHLLSATVGDIVPNQVGVNEGVYIAFSGWMGLAHAPERALSVALVIRIAQLSLALICLATSSVLGRNSKEGRRSEADAGVVRRA